MTIRNVALFVILIYGFTGFCQSTVKGTFASSDKRSVCRLKVALLTVSDSAKLQTKKTDKYGHFKFDNVPAGDYILRYKRKRQAASYIDFDFEGLVADFGIINID